MSIHSSLPDPDRAKKLQLVSKFVKFRTSANFIGWTELLTDDICFTIVGDRASCPLCGVFRGKEEFCDAFRALHVHYELIGDLQIGSYVVDDDHVAVQLSSPWRSRGTGRALEHESFNIFVFENDLLKRYELFLDTAVLAEFAGESWTLHRDRQPPLGHARLNSLSISEETFRTDIIRLHPLVVERNRARQIDIASQMARCRISADFATLKELATDDILFKISGDWTLFRFCGTYIGREALYETFRFTRMNWEFLADSEPRSFIVDGAHVVFRRSSRWRSRASGMVVDFESANHLVLEGDRVREYSIFLDTAALACSDD